MYNGFYPTNDLFELFVTHEYHDKRLLIQTSLQTIGLITFMLQQHMVMIGIGKGPISIMIISENKIRLCVTNLELKLLGPVFLYSLYNPYRIGDRILNS
jgi:hypothetical protein